MLCVSLTALCERSASVLYVISQYFVIISAVCESLSAM